LEVIKLEVLNFIGGCGTAEEVDSLCDNPMPKTLFADASA